MSNAVDLDSILDTIYSWIASRNLVDDQKIHIEDINIDRPLPPSISFRFLTLPSMVAGRDNAEYSGVDDNIIISGPRDLTISIKTHGVGAGQNASNLHNSLELDAVQQLFQASNIAVRVAETPQNISQELESGIEQQYNLDIIFGVTSIQTEDQGAIETINIVNAKVKDVTGATVQTVDETITKP